MFDINDIRKIIGEPDCKMSQYYPSILLYVLQRRSVFMHLPRGSGKTTFIANSAKCGDLIICSRTVEASQFFSNFKVRAYSVDQLYEKMFGEYSRGRRPMFDMNNYPDTVWIDEVDSNKGVMLAAILEKVLVSYRQSVISLGTEYRIPMHK